MQKGKLEQIRPLLEQGAYLESAKIIEASKILRNNSYVVTDDLNYFIEKIFKYLGEIIIKVRFGKSG